MTAKPRMPSPGFEIRNRIPAFAWGFIAVFLGMVGLFTWNMVRDGPHPSQPAPLQVGALGLFWIGGVVAAVHVGRIPCTRLHVLPDGSVLLARRWPLLRREERIAPDAIDGVEVRRGRDSDGDPYFTTVLALRDGREEPVAEGHDEAGQRALAARLKAALASP